MSVISGRLLGAARWQSLLRQYGMPLSYLDSHGDVSNKRSTTCRCLSSTTSTHVPKPPSASPITPPLASHLASFPTAHSPPSSRPTLRLLRLHTPILAQLQLEESLLRLSPHSYLIINYPPPTTPPTIVLGISGRPELWLNVAAVRQRGIQCVRRFTGGGTVYCDAGTFFITLMLARSDVSHIPPYPQPLLEYTGRLYQPVFDGLGGSGGGGVGGEDGGDVEFNVRGNDYCFGHRKFAGNAQSITRDKLLHHTSFLHTVNTTQLTTLLAMPPTARRPAYRADRPHTDFVTSIAHWLGEPDRAGAEGMEGVVERIGSGLVGVLESEGWDVVEEEENVARQWMESGKKYDRVLKVLDWDEELARIEREQAEKAAKERSASI